MSESVNFDRAAPFYDDTRGLTTEIHERLPSLLVEAGGLTSSSRILEMGVGTGRIALPLAPFVGSYTGVDISRGMMSRLRAKEGGTDIHIAEANITQLPFPNATFHAIVENHVLHLVPNYERALREASRVLKTGGVYLRGRGGRPRLHVESLPDRNVTRRGLNENERNDVMNSLGWERLAEYSLRVPATVVPRLALDSIEGRVWSGLWAMDDDAYREYAIKAREVITATYPNLDAPLPSEASFHVEVWMM